MRGRSFAVICLLLTAQRRILQAWIQRPLDEPSRFEYKIQQRPRFIGWLRKFAVLAANPAEALA